MTFDELVNVLLTEFDTPQSNPERWVNLRQKRMVAESLWRAAKKSLGNTVANQSNYTLPADVVDLKRIRIDGSDGTTLYDATGLEELWALDSAKGAYWQGPNGLFAEDYLADGTVEVRLHPAPEVGGLAITGLQALQPATMTFGTGASPIIPEDLHVYLLHGGRADGFTEVEERPDVAGAYEQQFAVGVQLLTARKRSRTGPGTPRVRVSGYDYSRW